VGYGALRNRTHFDFSTNVNKAEFMIDRQPYLDRIGYRGSTAPTRETLRAIHRAHRMNGSV